MNLFTKYKWTYRHKITNKDLLYSTGNHIQYLIITYNGKESKNNMHIYLHVCVYIYN